MIIETREQEEGVFDFNGEYDDDRIQSLPMIPLDKEILVRRRRKFILTI